MSERTSSTEQYRKTPFPARRRLLTIEEAAERLNISPNTLYSWHSQGIHLPFVSIGRRVMVDVADLEAFIEDNRSVPRNLDANEKERRLS